MAIVDRVRDVVTPLLESRGLELYDVEMNGNALRVTVDQDGGVLLDDLAELTRALSHELDETDPVPSAYTLEVSSPGVERRLRTASHYAGAVGEDVSVKLGPHVDGDRRVTGRLVEATERSIAVETEDGARVDLDLDDITKAVTVFAWGPGPKPGSTKKPKNRDADTSSSPDDPERRAAVR